MKYMGFRELLYENMMPFMRLQHLQILEYTGRGGGRLGINPLKYED